ncbi:phage protein NinX family protein [Paraburkholderia agricolaris]|uniref:phage protein NinX family protein n=1 Tax=Paraburkholderia agricolaris TaxID=2152888 RepID=UPI001291847A|nr:phage protein NinX family protein [Paraburkholderia agricolaris]
MKVDALNCSQLDHWVARAEGYSHVSLVPHDRCGTWYAGESSGGINDWTPSTNWGQGGPIIERERIIVKPYKDGTWGADYEFDPDARGGHFYMSSKEGDTPLVAAMRAYVAAKFGDELPDVRTS